MRRATTYIDSFGGLVPVKYIRTDSSGKLTVKVTRSRKSYLAGGLEAISPTRFVVKTRVRSGIQYVRTAQKGIDY